MWLKKCGTFLLILSLLAQSVLLFDFSFYSNLAQASDTCVANPTSTITGLPVDSMIGEDISFSLSFSNPGVGSTGYGPFLDLILPAGADGNDGLSFQNASFLGTSVVTTEISAPIGGGTVAHPYEVDNAGNAVPVTLAAGESLVVFQLPFGSFIENQSALNLSVEAFVASTADAGTVQNIKTRAGFQFGCDALDNPTTDPSDTEDSFNTFSFTPTIFKMNKRYVGPENETATGPNYERQYIIEVDIASGQSITDLVIEDLFPKTLVYTGLGPATPIGFTDTSNHAGQPANPTNNVVSVDYAGTSITGTTATVDASVAINFYVADVDADGVDVVLHTTGLDTTSINNARATGDWDPIDSRDAARTIVSDAVVNDHTLTNQALAIQKSVVNQNDIGGTGYTPGDTVQYTLAIQISDYFGFSNLQVDDELGDGLRFDNAFTPQLTLSYNGVNTTYDLNAYTISALTASGTQPVNFDLNAELLAEIGTTTLLGACIPDGGTGGAPVDCVANNDGPATMSIVYRADIQDDFDVIGPDISVDLGDVLNNTVLLSADLISNSNLATSTTVVTDDSASSVRIIAPSLQKSIAYINGCATDDTLFGGGACTFPVSVSAGDVVTYQVTQTLPSSDFEDLVISDFLPLPVFQVGSVNVTPLASFSNPTTTPGIAVIAFGPNHTFDSIAGSPSPVVSMGGDNEVRVSYGDFDDPGNNNSVIELLISVEVSNEPYADGLQLTNHAFSTQSPTQGSEMIGSEIVQITLRQPGVEITKGVIATSDNTAVFSPATIVPPSVIVSVPGSCAMVTGFGSGSLATSSITSDVSNVAGSSTVTFAVVLENQGQGRHGAFDVQVSDVIPDGFIDPGINNRNLCVMLGDGTVLATSTNYVGDLFSTSSPLTLIDQSTSTGSLAPYNPASPNSGDNIVIITYDLVIDSNAAVPNQAIVNTATLQNFASTEGGPDFTVQNKTDAAQVTTQAFGVQKNLLATNATGTVPEPPTLAPEVTIGEIVTYQVQLTVPELLTMSNVTWRDTLPFGMVLYDSNGGLPDTVQITASGTVSATAGSLSALEPIVTASGRSLEISLGTLNNTDTNPMTPERIVLTYQVVVTDEAGNQRNDLLRNNTLIEYHNENSAIVSTSGNRPDARVAEPNILITKGSPTLATTNTDSERVFTYEIVLQHDGNARQSPAYDVRLLDESFNNVTIQSVANPFSISNLATTVNGSCSASGSPLNTSSTTVIDLLWTELPVDCSGAGNNVIVTFDVTLNGAVRNDITQPDFRNTATINYYSLPDRLTQQSSFLTTGASSTERLYTQSDSYDVAWLFSPTVEKCLWNSGLGACFGVGYDVVVGDTVQYRSRVVIPEDTTFSDLELIDTMDSGLALVRFDSLVASSDLTNVSGLTSPEFINLSTANATTLELAAQSASTSVAVNGSGNQFTIKFGDVTHADNNDGLDSYIDVIYTAAVTNIGTNIRGQNLNNVLVANWTASTSTRQTATAASANVRIDEPELVVSKVATSAPSINGRTVTYQIELGHSALSLIDNRAAFGVRLLDDSLAQAPNVSLPGIGGGAVNPAWDITNVTIDTTCGATGLTNNNNVTTIDLSWATVPVSCTTANPIRITFDATLDAAVIGNQIIANTAEATWSSQVGDQTATTSPYTNFDVERTGDTSDIGGATNDYTTVDRVVTNFTFGPGGVKSAVSTTDPNTSLAPLNVAIGEIVTYQYALTLAGDAFYEDFQITDSLPAGMRLYFDPTASYNTAGGWFDVTVSSSSLTASVGLNNPVVATTSSSFNLSYYIGGPASGDVVANTDPNPQTITVEYKAVVRDVVGNSGEDGSETTLVNSAHAGWLSPTPDDPDTLPNEYNGNARASTSLSQATATVVEPDLSITKDVITQPAGVNSRAIEYQFTICHTADSTANAYDVAVLDDTVDLVFDPSSISVSGNVIAPTTVTTGGSSQTAINISFDQIPLSFSCASNPIVVTFDAELSSLISSDINFVNEVDLDWSTLPASLDLSGEARTSSDSDTSTGIFTFDLDFSKTILGSGSEPSTPNGTATIGEIITYQLSVPLPGVLFYDDFVLSDSLPAGMVFTRFTGMTVSSSSVTSNDGTAATSTVIDLTDVAALNSAAASTTDTTVVVSNNGRNFAIDFDRLQNTALGIETVTITYQALVTNVASNVSGQVLTNTATTEWDDGGPQIKTATTTQVVREPSLDVSKSIVLSPAGEVVNGLGQVTYQFVLTHNGDTVTAHDVVITDDLRTVADPNGAAPVGATGFMDFYLDFIPGSVTATTSSPTTQQVDLLETRDSFALKFNQLLFGETATVTAAFLVDQTTLADGFDFDNEATVAWSSIAGDVVTNLSPYSTDDDQIVERTASSGLSILNTYTDSDTLSSTISYVDLELSQSLSASTGAVGDEVIYTIRIKNTSGEDATGITVTVPLPEGMGFVSSSSTVGTYNFVNNVWTIGTIDAGDEFFLTITALIDDSGDLSSRAFISGANQPDIDSVPSSTITNEDDESPVTLTVNQSASSAAPRKLVGCKDNKATNFNRAAAAHRSSACVYPAVPVPVSLIDPATYKDILDKLAKILGAFFMHRNSGDTEAVDSAAGEKGFSSGSEEAVPVAVRQSSVIPSLLQSEPSKREDKITDQASSDLSQVNQSDVEPLSDSKNNELQKSFWQRVSDAILFWR